jgi:cell division protein FtsQ
MKTRKKTKKSYPKKKRRKSGNSSPIKFLFWIASGFFKIFLVVALMVVLGGSFVFIYNYLHNSPYLRLKEIVVEGVDDSTKNEMINLAGLEKGMSIVAINLDEVRYEIEAHPWIRSVKMKRQLPNKLIIQAEKQEPIAVIAAENIYYLNKYGEIFKQVEDSEFIDLPVVTGIIGKEMPSEKDIGSVCQTIKLLKNQEKPLSSMDLSEIHFRDDGGVSVYFKKMKIEIRTGLLGIENKIDSLRKVVAHLNRTGKISQVGGIDLNYSNGIVVSFKNG